MARFSLAAYSLRVRNRGSRQCLDLSNFAQNVDILPFFDQYLTSRCSQCSHDQVDRKLLRVKTKTVTGRRIKGIVETGEYGYTAELIDVVRQLPTHSRGTSEAEMLPFYFLADLPVGQDQGIVLLQRFQQFGIRKALLTDFSAYFARQHPDLLLELNPIANERLITEWMGGVGRVMKLRFIRFTLPSDIADLYPDVEHAEQAASVEYVVRAKRRGSIPIVGRVREYLEGRRALERLVEITGFSYDLVKAEVEINGTVRTLDLSNRTQPRAYFDVTERVLVNEDGHPRFDSIDGVAEELLADLAATMGVSE